MRRVATSCIFLLALHPKMALRLFPVGARMVNIGGPQQRFVGRDVIMPVGRMYLSCGKGQTTEADQAAQIQLAIIRALEYRVTRSRMAIWNSAFRFQS